MSDQIIPVSQVLRLSVSKTKTFVDCKKKFKFNYLDKLPKKEWHYHVYGKFLHKILENYHRFYVNAGVGDIHVIMSLAWQDAYIEFREKLNPEQKAEARETITKYLKILVDESKNPDAAKVIAVEKDFNIELDASTSLIGFIDRVQVDSDGIIHVCDYKTSKSKRYLKNDFFQLLTYAYVLLLEDPSIEKIRGSYIMLKHNFDYITTDFTRDQILSMKDKFLDYAKSINNEVLYRPTVGPLCGYCDFLAACDSGNQFINPGSVYGAVKW